MNKIFLFAKHVKTSDNCNRFSKSVSYETLVGGTTTTGSADEQARCLNKGSAGYRFCKTIRSSYKNLVDRLLQTLLVFKKVCKSRRKCLIGSINLIRRSLEFFAFAKNRDDSFFVASPRTRFSEIATSALRLLAMTPSTLALAAVLAMGTISESWAECTASRSNYWSNGCYDTWNPGVTDNCGDGCTYSYNNGKLTITATKPGAVIPKGIFSPLYYEPNVYPNVTDIEIDGEFKSINVHAFLYGGANISGKDGVLHLKNVDTNTFQGNTLTGTIIISDEITKITGQWYYANLDATVILPPSVQSASAWALHGLWLGENAKIYCGAENCEELFRNVNCDEIGEPYNVSCKNNISTLLTSGKLLPYPDGCAVMGSTGCNKCKSSSFRLNDGECDRIRYTPAEAAEVLKDTDNEIIMTFKVNR